MYTITAVKNAMLHECSFQKLSGDLPRSQCLEDFMSVCDEKLFNYYRCHKRINTPF